MAGGADSKLTYKNGTLYTTKDQSKALGFSVSPDVKVVLCLSDGTGHSAGHGDGCFDDCDDGYTGYAGLERAIRNLDENFVGELSVLFKDGDAVVIILVDQTLAENVDGDDGDEEDANTHAKAVVDDASLVIESLITVDGNYKTPIADALKAKGLRVTGWTEANAGAPAAKDTVTAVDDKGTVFTYEFGTAAANPDEEYWTLKVDGTVKEEILNGGNSKLMQSAITGKGTGYLTGNTYAAYAPAATTTPAVSSASAATVIETGYVAMPASVTTADTTGGTNVGFTSATATVTPAVGTGKYVKVGDKVSVSVAYVATGSGTKNAVVSLVVEGATAPTKTETVAKTERSATITFEFTAVETDITKIQVKVVDAT